MINVKYRLWDEDNKSFCYLDFDNLENTRSLLDSFEDYFSSTYFKDNPSFIQQFTGLKNRVGKEIYTGDLYLDNWDNLMVVYFENGCFSVKMVKGDYANYLINEIENSEPIEIIGSIHQNPELLNLSNK